jgi:hypothetical protein
MIACVVCYVCMYVCACVCMYKISHEYGNYKYIISIGLRGYIYGYTCTSLLFVDAVLTCRSKKKIDEMHARIHTHTHTHLQTHTHLHTHTSTHTHTAHTHTPPHTHTLTHTHTHTHKHTYTHTSYRKSAHFFVDVVLSCRSRSK